jgi:hypothetical protein
MQRPARQRRWRVLSRLRRSAGPLIGSVGRSSSRAKSTCNVRPVLCLSSLAAARAPRPFWASRRGLFRAVVSTSARRPASRRASLLSLRRHSRSCLAFTPGHGRRQLFAFHTRALRALERTRRLCSGASQRVVSAARSGECLVPWRRWPPRTPRTQRFGQLVLRSLPRPTTRSSGPANSFAVGYPPRFARRRPLNASVMRHHSRWTRKSFRY